MEDIVWERRDRRRRTRSRHGVHAMLLQAIASTGLVIHPHAAAALCQNASKAFPNVVPVPRQSHTVRRLLVIPAHEALVAGGRLASATLHEPTGRLGILARLELASSQF